MQIMCARDLLSVLILICLLVAAWAWSQYQGWLADRGLTGAAWAVFLLMTLAALALHWRVQGYGRVGVPWSGTIRRVLIVAAHIAVVQVWVMVGYVVTGGVREHLRRTVGGVLPEIYLPLAAVAYLLLTMAGFYALRQRRERE